jgi:hypothetical protein
MFNIIMSMPGMYKEQQEKKSPTAPHGLFSFQIPDPAKNHNKCHSLLCGNISAVFFS